MTSQRTAQTTMALTNVHAQRVILEVLVLISTSVQQKTAEKMPFVRTQMVLSNVAVQLVLPEVRWTLYDFTKAQKLKISPRIKALVKILMSVIRRLIIVIQRAKFVQILKDLLYANVLKTLNLSTVFAPNKEGHHWKVYVFGVTWCDWTFTNETWKAPPVDECAEGLDNCDVKTSVCVDQLAGFSCQCLDRYVEQPDGTCSWDIDSCSTLDIDWKVLVHNLVTFNYSWSIFAKSFQGQLATLTETGADAAEIRVNQWRMPETNSYTGFVIFARKYCGDDFLQALVDGRLLVDWADREPQWGLFSSLDFQLSSINRIKFNPDLQYSPVAAYYRLDGSRTSATLQYRFVCLFFLPRSFITKLIQ